MAFWVISIVMLLIFSGCKKSEEPVAFSEAIYKVTITGRWQQPQFTVPTGAHFTAFSGMVHKNDVSLWAVGKLASAGVEGIAETGSQFFLFSEVDSMILNRLAISSINIPAPAPAGNISRNIYCNSNYANVTLLSMVAPSPDWFVGVNNLQLYTNGSWVADTTLPLVVYDAGTEDGDVFSLSNPATTPQQPITILTAAKATVLANGNAALGAIATIRFTRL